MTTVLPIKSLSSKPVAACSPESNAMPAEIVKTLCHKSGISKNQRAGLYLSNPQP